MVRVLVTIWAPVQQWERIGKISLETRLEYPGFLKKKQEFAEYCKEYTIYECEDAKLLDAWKFLYKRFLKVATKVEGYNFTICPVFDPLEWGQFMS